MIKPHPLVSLAACLDREPVASIFLPPDWAWALTQRARVERIELSSATLRLRSAGAGQRAIVFLIDPPNTVEHYDVLLQALEREARVVCVELPGFGFSTPGAHFDFSVRGYAALLNELLAQLDLGPSILVGSCVWAYAALTLAAQAPARVAGLVLTQSPCWQDERSWSRRIDTRGVVRRAGLGQLAMYAARSRVAKRWYESALPLGVDRGFLAEPAQSAIEHGARFALGSLTQAWFRGEPPKFAAVAQPARLVWGAADRTHRRSRAGSLLELTPNARCVAFDGCGHFPELEAPARFLEVLRSIG